MASELVLNYILYVYFDVGLSHWLYINPAWSQVSYYGNAKCFASRPSKRQLLDGDLRTVSYT